MTGPATCGHGTPHGRDTTTAGTPRCPFCRTGTRPRDSLAVGDPDPAPSGPATAGRAVAALLAHRRTHPAPDHLTDRGERWWRH
jgi:hypothetical protein